MYISIYYIQYTTNVEICEYIIYREQYIIYTLRAREENSGSGYADRRSCWTRLIQPIPFPGHVIDDHDFSVTLKRVKNAP